MEDLLGRLATGLLAFSDIGLLPAAPDSQIWITCQAAGLVLITDNRNEDEPDSLQATIQTKNTPESLPIITVANVPHLRRSRDYADRVIEKTIDFLERMETLRGTGRLFVP